MEIMKNRSKIQVAISNTTRNEALYATWRFSSNKPYKELIFDRRIDDVLMAVILPEIIESIYNQIQEETE